MKNNYQETTKQETKLVEPGMVHEKALILRFYAYSFFSSLIFFLPIDIIFFKSCGLKMAEIYTLITIGAVGNVVFEVPTGVIADFFGKKKSLMTGMMVLVVSCMLFYMSTSFIFFIIAYLTWALGYTMLSGADAALLHELLNTENKKDYKKYRGTSRFVGLTGISISSMIGGFIAAYSLRLTFAFSAVAFIICFIILVSIKQDVCNDRKKLNYQGIIANSIDLIKSSKWVMLLFTYIAVFATVYKIFNPLPQVYMSLVDLDIRYYGIASTYFFLVAAIATKLAHFFENKFKKFSYAILGVLLTLNILIISRITSKGGVLFFGVIFLSVAIATIIVEHEILKVCPAKMHATALSFSSLLNNLLFMICNPIFGLYLGEYGFKDTLIRLDGIVVLILLFLILGLMRNLLHKNLIELNEK